MSSRQRTLEHAAALMTIIIWGTTFVSTKVLLRDFTPVTVLFTRFVIGYAFLWCLKPRVLPFSGWKKELLFAGAGLTGVTLYFLLENIALTYTFASNVGIIVAVVPFFTALLAHFLLKGEGFSRRFFLGFAASFTGIFLIMANGAFVLELNPAGDILGAGSGLRLGGVFHSDEKNRRQHVQHDHLHAPHFFLWHRADDPRPVGSFRQIWTGV